MAADGGFGDLRLATAGGLYRIDATEPEVPEPGVAATVAGGRWWVLTDDGHLLRSGQPVASLSGVKGRTLLRADGEMLVGTSEARLFRLDGQRLEPDPSFDRAPGRETWYTPWGGPPDTRSLASETSGTLYANVHVGGILRSEDGGEWEPTIDVDADVHQVIAEGGMVLAATAYGLATSKDGGGTWDTAADGLHGPYCRAVAVSHGTVLVTASTGPFTERAAVYRRGIGGGKFERCGGGLPEWFPANIDTHCLSASGGRVAVGTDTGDVWVSEDEGLTWRRMAEGLPSIRSVAFGS
jgi:hypothetical protein